MIPYTKYYRVIKTGEIVILFLKEEGHIHTFPAPKFDDITLLHPLPDKLSSYPLEEVEFVFEGNVFINSEGTIMIYYDEVGAYNFVVKPDFKNITDVPTPHHRRRNYET